LGEARRSKRYMQALQYAENNQVSLEIASRRVRCFETIRQRYKKACKCPKCGMNELMIDSTDYEFTNNESWVWCYSCGFTSDIHKKHESLLHWYGFDDVAAMASEKDAEFSDWNRFALESTIVMEHMLFEGVN